MPDATRRVPIIIAILLALAIGLAFTVPPLYRGMKSRRAHRAVAEMDAALAKDDLATAGLRVRLALSLSPNEAGIQRAAARYCMQAGSAVALQYWQILLDSGRATRADRIDYVRALVRFDHPALARQHLTRLLEEDIRDRECLELSVRALLLERRYRDALTAARMIAEFYPDDERGKMGLGELLLIQPESRLRKQGQDILWGIALRDTPLRTPAIALLAQQTNLSRGDLLLLARQLPRTNDLTASLIRLEIEEKTHPDTHRDEILQQALQSLRTNAPLQETLILADWLLTRGFHQPALNLIPEHASRTNNLAFQRRLQGLANLGEWKQVATLVEDPSMPLTPVMRDIYRAIVASRIGSPDEVTAHLSNASKGTRNEPAQCRLVASYAEAFDQPRIAAEALQNLMANPSQVPRVGPDMIRILSQVDDTQPILLALDRLLQFNPDDPRLRNERAWWLAVTGQRIDHARQTVTELLKDSPGNLRYLATLSLSHLRENNPDRAIEVIETSLLQSTNAPLRARLAYCAALGASGQREGARRFAATLDVSSLRSAEKRLIADWIKETGTP